MRPGRFLLSLFLTATLWIPGLAQEREKPLTTEDFHKILDGLERGGVALKRLGMHEEARELNRIADRVRAEIRQERGGGEREVAKAQIQVLRMAKAAFQEAGKEALTEQVHWAIRAREVGLEGRREEEAHEIRRRAPDREGTIELLVHAERLYREWGKEDRASHISKMTEKLWSRPEEGAERETARRESEIMRLARPALREALRHEIEVFGIARHAFEEAERRDAADIMKRAAHVREMRLSGQVSREIQPPSREMEIKLLTHAAELWMEWGHEEKARAVGHLARELKGQPREREIDELRERLGELERAVRELHEELERLRRSEF